VRGGKSGRGGRGRGERSWGGRRGGKVGEVMGEGKGKGRASHLQIMV